MSDPGDHARLASAVAAAQAAMRADDLVGDQPPGTPGRRDRMRAIIRAAADAWDVERMDLTMALASASRRDAAPD